MEGRGTYGYLVSVASVGSRLLKNTSCIFLTFYTRQVRSYSGVWNLMVKRGYMEKRENAALSQNYGIPSMSKQGTIFKGHHWDIESPWAEKEERTLPRCLSTERPGVRFSALSKGSRMTVGSMTWER